MTIAITGSTGQLGRIIIETFRLSEHADDIIALARSPQRATDLKVPVRHADYDIPETLGPALAGIGTLLLISGSEIGKRAKQHATLIGAAKAAGVEHIVYTSILHAGTSVIDLAEEHRATESTLEASGIPHTLLRNGWYTENYAGSIAAALAHGALFGSAGDGNISAATRADFAEAAVAVLTSKEHQGKTHELAGDEAFTLPDLAAEITRQSGTNITYKDLPPDQYAAMLVETGLPEALAHAVAGWDVATSQGALFDEGRQLSSLIGRPTTPLSEVVRGILAAEA